MRGTRYCIVLLWRTGVGPVFSVLLGNFDAFRDIGVARADADRTRMAVDAEEALV